MKTAAPTRVDLDCRRDAAMTAQALPGGMASSARTQAAFVRALLHEAGRHLPSDIRVLALREQIEEERARLSRMESALAGGGE
jgi:hypothetical protein